MTPIRVLIAEDSPTASHYLAALLSEAEGLVVVGQARDGEEALRLVDELRPDVVSMDIRMPGMDGLEATRRIMSRWPTPVVIVSGLLEREVDLSFQAIQAGALAVVEKPPHRGDATFPARRRQLINTLSAMARVRVVRRWENMPGQNGPAVGPESPEARRKVPPEVIAIGASAGGPGALAVLLNGLKADFPLPVLIVQHIPDEFLHGLARWLGKVTPLRVRLADDNAPLEAGVVHLAPGAAHLTIRRHEGRLFTRLIRAQGDYRHQPAVDVLFESVAGVCGPAAVGIVLTGMGDDGAAGLLAMRRAGALTLAQDEASSTVFGMPGAAVSRGAVDQVLALSNLAITLSSLI